MPGLTRSARRRWLAESEPGALIVMGKNDLYGVRGRDPEGNAIRVRKGSIVDLGIRTDVLAWSLDCRELVRRVQAALAVHYAGEVLEGRQANGRPMPISAEGRDPDLAPGVRLRPWVGVRSGVQASHYRWSRTSGHALAARGHVMPYTGAKPGEDRGVAIGRAKWAANAGPDHGVSLVAVSGSARQVIEDVVDQWLRDARADRNGTVKTSPLPPSAAGGLQWGRPDGTAL